MEPQTLGALTGIVGAVVAAVAAIVAALLTAGTSRARLLRSIREELDVIERLPDAHPLRRQLRFHNNARLAEYLAPPEPSRWRELVRRYPRTLAASTLGPGAFIAASLLTADRPEDVSQRMWVFTVIFLGVTIPAVALFGGTFTGWLAGRVVRRRRDAVARQRLTDRQAKNLGSA